MQIGELAKRSGVNVQTVRFYERTGLLPEPERRESGYRNYSQQDLRRLRFIRQAKALGFSLAEIGEVLRVRQQGQCPCVDVIAMAERHLQNVQRQIRELEKFRRALSEAVRGWKKSGEKEPSVDAFCSLIERTMNGTSEPTSQR